MKNLIRFSIIYCALMPNLSWSAGLDLADTPLFVAEVLAPNVVISPVYAVDFNESVLKDVPWSDAAQKAILNAAPWNASILALGRAAFRVTPWPNTVKHLAGVADGCRDAGSATYACSTTSLYPDPDVYTKADGVKYNSPLGYLVDGEGDVLKTFFFSSHYGQEVYPQQSTVVVTDTTGTADTRYDVAKSRYFHSDSNFLYFNPTVAAANAYQPWPALGGNDAFPVYATADEAKAAWYSPLPARAGAGTVRLDSFVDNWVTNSGGTKVFDYKAYVGQYWTKTAGASVTDLNSFVGTCWDKNADTLLLGCSTAMTDTERIRFANWFTYWRSSNLATRGMLGGLFDRLKQADLLDKFRFGISANSTVNGFYSVANAAGATKAERTADFLATIRNSIYSDSTRFAAAWDPAATNTRLKQLDAYRDTAGGPIRTCRRNYEILLTPDYSRLSYGGTRAPQAVGTADKLPGVPYPDEHADMWSDVGALGWATDLCKDVNDPCGDLANTLLPGLRDQATHQHVVRYIIGPNAEGGAIFPKGVLSYEEAKTKADLATSQAIWPAKPVVNQVEFAVSYDDLWHMALNSHGFFYPSDNVKEAVGNLLNAFNDIISRNVSGSSVATNTTSLSSGGQIYQAAVETDWKGHLRAYSVSPELQTINGVEQSVLSVNNATPLWDLAERVSAAGSRRIFTYNLDTGEGAPFQWASIGATAVNSLKAGFSADEEANKILKAEKLLAYLRGSGECEDGATTTCSAGGVSYVFRRRNIDRSNHAPYSLANPNGHNVLGDIANSNPWFVPPPAAGISDVDYPGYNAYRLSKKSRLNVIYVGANDGMLHAIRTDNIKDANGEYVAYAGEELFAYIPSFVRDNLYYLADPGYGHKFYVDGSPFSSDVYIDGVGWKTVLGGGVNKGGKGYYLLNITDPSVNAETAEVAQNMVLWEFTHPDMHYTYNLPVAFPVGNTRAGQARQFARLKNGKWVMIVGNGYASEAAKQACLFVINVSGPGNDGWTVDTDYKKLCVGATGYTNDGGLDTNGLSTPTPYDTDGDGNVDVVYAGDLNGNMWRFDIAAADTGTWTAPLTPLFVARDGNGKRQPIFVPPEVTSHTVGNLYGRLVLFGTGKYIELGDRSNTDVQSFYGIWDRHDAEFTNMSRSALYQQSFAQVTIGSTIIRNQATKVPIGYCTGAALADCDPDGTVATGKMGWYWDMGDDVQHNIGERITGRVNLFSGTVFFNTFYPVTDASGALDPCQYGGSGWIMGLNAVNGYMEDQQQTFDVDLNGVIDSLDVNSAGVKLGAAIGGTTFSRAGAGSKVGVYSPTNLGTAESEGKKMLIVIKPGADSSGRVSWFELLE